MSKSKGTDIVTIALLGALGVGGFLIFKNRKEIGNFFGGIGEGVQDFTDGVGKWYGDTIEGIQKGVDDVGKNVGGFFDGIVKGTTNFFGGVGIGLQNTITGIQKGAQDFADNAGNFFGGIAEGAGDLVQGIGDFFSGKRVTEGAPMTTTKAPEYSNTVLQNGKLVEKDAKIKMIEKTSGQEVKEIIGAPSTLTKEERAKLPTKSFEELAQRNDFIGTVAKLAVKVKEGGYKGNILQNLKK